MDGVVEALEPFSAVPLGLADGRGFHEQFMSHRVIDIVHFGTHIVYVSMALGNVPRQDATKQTPVHNYVFADVFTPDFAEHTHLVNERTLPWGQSAWHTDDAECEVAGQALILNTMKWHKFWDISGDWRARFPGLGRLYSISDQGIHDIGEAPDPSERVFPDSITYRFNDRIVRMASPFIMECTSDSGEVLWKLRMRSYLYTSIEAHDSMLYFGTDGNGGRLYGVSLDDGREVFSVNTGGTSRFAWWEGNVVCEGHNDEILIVSSLDGTILRTISLGPLKPQVDSPMVVVDDRLYMSVYGQGSVRAVAVELNG